MPGKKGTGRRRVMTLKNEIEDKDILRQLGYVKVKRLDFERGYLHNKFQFHDMQNTKAQINEIRKQ